jgi:hypothetical protein
MLRPEIRDALQLLTTHGALPFDGFNPSIAASLLEGGLAVRDRLITGDSGVARDHLQISTFGKAALIREMQRG